MREIFSSFIVGIVITVILLPFQFLSALILAGWAVLFFNLSGITVLAAVGYWSLVWIIMACMGVVGSGASYSKMAMDSVS